MPHSSTSHAPQTGVVPSPFGPLVLTARGDRIVSLEMGRTDAAGTPRSDVLAWAARELAEYFAGARKTFTVPLELPDATPFRRRVWDAMNKIPYGEVRTYGELAAELATAPRAVGGACGHNPLPILIPCHRVVAKTGLGGYAGDWEKGKALSVKQRLLELERQGR